jgi:hypothetical protein
LVFRLSRPSRRPRATPRGRLRPAARPSAASADGAPSGAGLGALVLAAGPLPLRAVPGFPTARPARPAHQAPPPAPGGGRRGRVLLRGPTGRTGLSVWSPRMRG